MSKLRRILTNTHKVLIEDEELLRLLAYPPQNLATGQPDPLEVTSKTPNIIDNSDDEAVKRMWEIINQHIVTSAKSDDLETGRICRIYLYAGKTRPAPRNAATLFQEIVVDVFCHGDYEEDYRMESIEGRLSQLLIGQRPDGLGRFDYRTGYDFVAPKGYRAYRHIYETVRTKR